MIVVTDRAERGHYAEADVIEYAASLGYRLAAVDEHVLRAYKVGEEETRHPATLEIIDVRAWIFEPQGLLNRSENFINFMQPNGHRFRWWEGTYTEYEETP